MRILHTEASSGWGGQEIRIVNECRVFAQHGHQVMIAADRDSQIIQRASEYGITTYPITLKKKRWAEFSELKEVLREAQADVISCHSSTDHWLSALARRTLSKKPALVRTRHISAPVTRNLPTRWLYKQATDVLMTTGQSIREALIADEFVNPHMIYSVPTGIDTSHFTPGDRLARRSELNLPADRFIFGIVAALRSWKGHVHLIEAFNQMANPETLLLIVGDGPQMQHYQDLIQQSPLSENIILTGHQSNVAPYLQAMDCFVLPSYMNEGIPQALLQAMAVGLPIISCPIGGIPECLVNYPQQTLVPPQDSTALCEAMQKEVSVAQVNSKPRIRHTPHDLESLYQSALAVYEQAIQQVRAS